MSVQENVPVDLEDDQEHDAARDALYAAVGSRVRRARVDAGMTQVQLADVLGISRSSVANLESGRQRISVWRLASLAQALGCSRHDLLPEAGFETPVRTAREATSKRLGATARELHATLARLQRLENELMDAGEDDPAHDGGAPS